MDDLVINKFISEINILEDHVEQLATDGIWFDYDSTDRELWVMMCVGEILGGYIMRITVSNSKYVITHYLNESQHEMQYHSDFLLDGSVNLQAIENKYRNIIPTCNLYNVIMAISGLLASDEKVYTIDQVYEISLSHMDQHLVYYLENPWKIQAKFYNVLKDTFIKNYYRIKELISAIERQCDGSCRNREVSLELVNKIDNLYHKFLENNRDLPRTISQMLIYEQSIMSDYNPIRDSSSSILVDIPDISAIPDMPDAPDAPDVPDFEIHEVQNISETKHKAQPLAHQLSIPPLSASPQMTLNSVDLDSIKTETGETEVDPLDNNQYIDQTSCVSATILDECKNSQLIDVVVSNLGTIPIPKKELVTKQHNYLLYLILIVGIYTYLSKVYSINYIQVYNALVSFYDSFDKELTYHICLEKYKQLEDSLMYLIYRGDWNTIMEIYECLHEHRWAIFKISYSILVFYEIVFV